MLYTKPNQANPKIISTQKVAPPNQLLQQPQHQLKPPPLLPLQPPQQQKQQQKHQQPQKQQQLQQQLHQRQQLPHLSL